jgi:uracil-DNA glycosylase
MTEWNSLQERINSCADCKAIGSNLIVACEQLPARPLEPKGGEILFISEAPPPEGGFWAPPPFRDGLREKLFSILRTCNISLPDPNSKGCLEAFVSRRFFLIQTVKWSLYESARMLRQAEQRLVEHSVIDHLDQEITLIQPTTIILLGKVACYASACMFGTHRFPFKSSSKLEKIRGKQFTAQTSDGRDIALYPTGLPVSRKAKDIPRICKEIKNALEGVLSD